MKSDEAANLPKISWYGSGEDLNIAASIPQILLLTKKSEAGRFLFVPNLNLICRQTCRHKNNLFRFEEHGLV